MGSSIITLTTDFGTADPYAGVMKGVILGINSGATIVDITHEIQPQSILEGAFVIGTSHRFFPTGTVHVVVVDPGVGTSRDALLLATPSAFFLAPDNGVLSRVMGEGFPDEPDVSEGRVAVPADHKAYRLTNPEFWLHPVSSTFHGRDVFAPGAGHLSLGVPVNQLGEEVQSLAWLPSPRPVWDGGSIKGRVVHVDRFGNLVTDIPASQLPRSVQVTIEVGGLQIQGLSPSYSEGDTILAIIGSVDTLEVSVKNGNAAGQLGAKVGDAVRVSDGRGTL